MSTEFNIDVVGLTFVAGYPSNLYRLEELMADAEASGEPLALLLVRNPNNEFDSNAIEVHVPALGDAGMVGHVARQMAAHLARRLDNGEQYTAYPSWVRINPEHEDYPGLTITVAM